MSEHTGPWQIGQRAEYTDESLKGQVVWTFNDGVNKVMFATDKGRVFACSDDHLLPLGPDANERYDRLAAAARGLLDAMGDDLPRFVPCTSCA